MTSRYKATADPGSRIKKRLQQARNNIRFSVWLQRHKTKLLGAGLVVTTAIVAYLFGRRTGTEDALLAKKADDGIDNISDTDGALTR